MSDYDKRLLQGSQAGMRLIAQLTIYNSGNLARLRTFIADSYSDDLLRAYPVEEWVANFASLADDIGKLRVMQVVAYDKHQVVVILAGQNGDLVTVNMHVEEDYPHKVIYHTVEPLD